MVDIGALEVRVHDLQSQLRQAELELAEAREREVAFRYRYVLNGRAQEGGYLRIVLPRGVTLVATPPGWNVGVTRWSGRVTLGRTVTRDEPQEHSFRCAAPRSWVRDHVPSAQFGSGDGDSAAEGITSPTAQPPVPLPVARGALPRSSAPTTAET